MSTPIHWSDLPDDVLQRLRRGSVVPAHPLALDSYRRLDERRQRALTRYYLDAGAGGLAVGVHATQFAIRDCGLYEPVLRLAMEETLSRPNQAFLIAGICGSTQQATREAQLARSLGYSFGLLSLFGQNEASEDDLIAHSKAIAAQIPLIGFYLQPAVGGRRLSANFWSRLATIDNVVAIKVAPFNRYATIEVMRGIVDAEAEDRIVLYTGNDDHILLDLVTPFVLSRGEDKVTLRFRGGLLGHWSVWTRRAVEMFERIQSAIDRNQIDLDLLGWEARITESNAAFFDAANNFAGCIPGCHEILRRQGLLQGTWCLDPAESLSPGQLSAIDRVYREYPELNDDDFVRANLERWLS